MIAALHSGGAPEYSAHGCCYLCRTAPDGLWVRTMQDIDYEGELVFCAGCVGTLASIIGWEDPNIVAKQRQTIRDLNDRVAELTAKADAFDLFASTYQGVTSEQAKPAPEATDPAPKPRRKTSTNKATTKKPAKAAVQGSV